MREFSGKMRALTSLEKEVHECTKCKEIFPQILLYSPVYSFGDPRNKKIFLVGLNPSKKEYERGFLSDSRNLEERRKSQCEYFQGDVHTYFEKASVFFYGEVKNLLGWEESPWEKVGVLDLVKCVTERKDGQWNDVTRNQQRTIIHNCEPYLIKQLQTYKPEIILPYGVDVCKRLARKMKIQYDEYEPFTGKINDLKFKGIFIPQRQVKHSKPEINWVQEKLRKLLNS